MFAQSILDKFFVETSENPVETVNSRPDSRPNRIHIYGYLIYFLVSLALLLPYVNSNYCHFDESMLLAEAKRIFLGELQHRDFFSFYGGGQFYLIAWVWRLFGETTYPVIKLFTFITITFGAVLLLLTTRRFTQRFWLSLLPSIIFLNYQAQLFPFSNHHWFGSVASIVFFYFVVRYLFSLSLWDLYGCGVATGLSLLFIMSEGLINLIASMIMIGAIVVLLRGRLSGCHPGRLLLVYFAGLATLMLPVMLVYLSQGVFKEYLYNTFLWPFDNYARKNNLNDLPWAVDIYYWRFGSGRFLHLSYFLTSCALLLLLLWPVAIFICNTGMLSAPASLSAFYRIQPDIKLAEKLDCARELDPSLAGRYQYLVIFVLVVMAAGLYSTPLRAQPEFIKLLWGSVRAFVLVALLLDRGLVYLTSQAGLRRALVIFIAFFFVTLATASSYNAIKIIRGDESQLITPETNRMTDQPVIDLINSETTTQDYIFAYNYRLTFLYFLLQARPATPFTLLTDGYLTPKQQQQLVTGLYQKNPKFIAFSSDEDMLFITKLAPDLTDWFNHNYRLRGHTEGLLLYQRRATE